MEMRFVSKVARFLLLMYGLVICGIDARGQSNPAASSSRSARLTEQEMNGKGLFLQRCSLCHARKLVKPYEPIGPVLDELFKGTNPRDETIVREFVLKGTPRMPGFQYALEPKQIEEIIAYLKTL